MSIDRAQMHMAAAAERRANSCKQISKLMNGGKKGNDAYRELEKSAEIAENGGHFRDALPALLETCCCCPAIADMLAHLKIPI